MMNLSTTLSAMLATEGMRPKKWATHRKSRRSKSCSKKVTTMKSQLPSRTKQSLQVQQRTKLTPTPRAKMKPQKQFYSSIFILLTLICIAHKFPLNKQGQTVNVMASLIIGDSAIEIQEVDSSAANRVPLQQQFVEEQSSVYLGSTRDAQLERQPEQKAHVQSSQLRPSSTRQTQMPSPLPPLSNGKEESRDSGSEGHGMSAMGLREPESLSNFPEEKTIAGKVVDFELTPAGGHNKAKIKKKKKKKKKAGEEMFKKWGKKKKYEKKAMEKVHKESMKKKKEEGKKGKKKWGVEEHGQKKKGNFKKKKWGKKVKKGKGVKKGKKGKKFLKDKGHKNTGFKTVYHKEEWGKSNKWHDIKREKKWDEKSKKWKKKWKKEKGKKYKGDHMKKFEKKKKSGKKFKKESKDKFKKFKKEKFEKGKKKKMEEHKKKKEGGMKKEKKEMEKKKKKKKG